MKTFKLPSFPEICVNFHLTNRCPFRCRYCHSTFLEESPVSAHQWIEIFSKINQETEHIQFRKLTLSGGEPLLVKNMELILESAKDAGWQTGIISCGLNLSEEVIRTRLKDADSIGVSVDSLDQNVNRLIGRSTLTGETVDYVGVCKLIKKLGKKLKINTVVHSLNWDQDLKPLLHSLKPDRVKFLQCRTDVDLRDRDFSGAVREDEYQKFVENQFYPEAVVESEILQSGSYIMLDPEGHLFDTVEGKRRKSPSLLGISFTEGMEYIYYDHQKFQARAGNYFSSLK